MRYGSEVRTLSPRSADDDRFELVPFEAVDAMAAARRVAEIAAVRRYDEEGNVGFLSRTEDDGWFRATIGVQRKSADGIALNGVSILIRVWLVD